MCALGMIAGATLFWLQMLRWRLRAKRLERRLSELEPVMRRAVYPSPDYRPTGHKSANRAGLSLLCHETVIGAR